VEFGWSDEDRAFRRELIEFLGEHLPDDWEELAKDGPGSDVQARFSREFCPKLAARGWLTQNWPREYGGEAASAWRHIILGEEMWRVGEPRSSQYMNVNWVGPTIMRYGTEAQRREHLPNGSKIWTSYVNHAQHCFLVVRTDPESKRHKGISVLLCPMDLPGIEVREIPSVVGERYFFEVFFTDVKVPVACRLGPENEGWDVVSYSLAYERVGAARYARAALTLDELARRAAERGLLDDPRILEKLGEARALCEASRLLTYRVIDLRERGLPPSADTNVARVAGTTAELAVANLALELFGSEALEYGNFAESHFRLAMTAGVAVGTTEVNLNLVASRFLDLPRE